MSDTTAHLNIPRPNRARVPPLNVDEEFDNLALAWDTVDAFLHALAQAVALKAPAEHEQAMSTIIGLVDALNEKMPKDRQFKLDDLADVNGAADAPAGYTVVKNATGMWVPSTPLAALGPHGHLISEITGLVAALASRPERSEVAAALDELGDAATKNVGTTVNTVAAGDDPRFAQSIAPVGSVLMVYGNGTTPAPGYLLMNGFSVTNTYPDLRAFGLANGWRVDGNGDPICPNMGGKFPRGWLPGQVVDSGRVFGTSQADASQKITGSYLNTTLESTNNAVTTEGAFFLDDTKQKSGAVSYATARTISAVGFDSSRVVRTAAETRPSNETFTFWIKAYGAHTDTSDIDLNGVVNDTTALKGRATSLEGRTTALEAKTLSSETWQTVTRTPGTVYQNTTGKFLHVNGNRSANGAIIDLADNVAMAGPKQFGSNDFTVFTVVPPGWYYRFNAGTWFISELR